MYRSVSEDQRTAAPSPSPQTPPITVAVSNPTDTKASFPLSKNDSLPENEVDGLFSADSESMSSSSDEALNAKILSIQQLFAIDEHDSRKQKIHLEKDRGNRRSAEFFRAGPRARRQNLFARNERDGRDREEEGDGALRSPASSPGSVLSKSSPLSGNRRSVVSSPPSFDEDDDPYIHSHIKESNVTIFAKAEERKLPKSSKRDSESSAQSDLNSSKKKGKEKEKKKDLEDRKYVSINSPPMEDTTHRRYPSISNSHSVSLLSSADIGTAPFIPLLDSF